jgi:hypothetical protein
MECNDFHKIKHSTLQLASASVFHMHNLKDWSDFTVIINKKYRDEQTVASGLYVSLLINHHPVK